jgi:hypothetical protein
MVVGSVADGSLPFGESPDRRRPHAESGASHGGGRPGVGDGPGGPDRRHAAHGGGMA